VGAFGRDFFLKPFRIFHCLGLILLSPYFISRDEAAAAMKDGEQELQMLIRQATISELYPSAHSVMET
jgi:hypothetical protein